MILCDSEPLKSYYLIMCILDFNFTQIIFSNIIHILVLHTYLCIHTTCCNIYGLILSNTVWACMYVHLYYFGFRLESVTIQWNTIQNLNWTHSHSTYSIEKSMYWTSTYTQTRNVSFYTHKKSLMIVICLSLYCN